VLTVMNSQSVSRLQQILSIAEEYIIDE